MYLIPIGTDQPRSRLPKVTLTIIIICFLLYPMSYFLRGFMGRVPYDFYYKYKSLETELMVEWLENKGEQHPLYAYKKLNYKPGKLKEALESFRQDMEAEDLKPELEKKYEKWKDLRAEFLSYRKKTFDYRLGYVPEDIRLHSFITHIFIHKNFWHVFWNMYFFWVVGIGLEEVWGRKLYLGFFLAGGIVAALGHHLFTVSPSIPTIGASGAVSALMGAYLVRFYNARLRFMFFKWEFWLQAWIFIGLWLGKDVYEAVSGIGEAQHVAVFAHLGGYAMGIIGALGISYSGIEEKYISRDLKKQDEKDRIKAEKKIEKKQMQEPPPRLPEFEQGIQARKEGNLDEARDLIGKAIEERPNDLEMREELLRIEQKLENHDGVARQTGEIIELYLQKNDLVNAFAWYSRFLRSTPNTRVAGPWNYRIATELYKKEHLDHAVAEFFRFAVGRPDDNLAPKALFTAALIQADKKGDPQKALQTLDRLQEKYPTWMPDQVTEARQRISKAGSST